MDIRIGVIHTAKEIEVELADDVDRDELKARVQAALGDGSLLWVTDSKGREIAVPGDKLAYVDLGSADSGHRIGFSS